MSTCASRGRGIFGEIAAERRAGPRSKLARRGWASPVIGGRAPARAPVLNSSR